MFGWVRGCGGEGFKGFHWPRMLKELRGLIACGVIFEV